MAAGPSTSRTSPGAAGRHGRSSASFAPDPPERLLDHAVTRAFESVFGLAPTYLVRAPGRVNLIGEHTDYNDLPVLPMALQRAVGVAVRPRDDAVVRIHDLAPGFEPVRFEVGVDIEPSVRGSWGNYLKAPAQELARRFGIRRGFDGMVGSDLPVASGLSSSSALVNAIGLALAEINQVVVDRIELAAAMADAERYTGTQGGGMDQAISMAAREGHAARIDFAPLRLYHIAVPADWRFVVADTGVRAEKSGAAQEAYNRRRRECEKALELVAAEAPDGVIPGAAGYPGLLEAVGTAGALDLGTRVLPEALLVRFRHVVTEAERVGAAQAALADADVTGFGRLMDASHESLRADYEVSSPELDELVWLAREGGAAGARLTGAGFGGCIVALAGTDTVEGVVQALIEGYYAPRRLPGVGGEQVFVAVPSAGASWTGL